MPGTQTNGSANGVGAPNGQLKGIPDYKDLPPVSGMPHGCTWGLWDRDGQPDDLGTLNKITPAIKLAARDEIQLGISVSINWSLDHCATPHSNRRPPQHLIKPLPDWTGHDDEIHINTQSGSQWDGFRHWAHQPTGLFYNGIEATEIREGHSRRIGIDLWTERGGVVGRGVLLDYLSWAQSNGIEYSPVKYHEITVRDLEAVAAAQGTELRPGDILLIRSGFVKWYEEASPEERVLGTSKGQEWSGVVGSEETVAWLWNRHFAAVGGDANVFEAWPAKDERYRLHCNLIALFGMPVGEMFDLEKLAETCKQHGRWTFLFTSSPLNFPGGIASPPNAICIL